ncbi:hypothetical protein PMAYCL1PPCAC_01877, partial [Pristionchus mayeri]
ILQVLKMEAAYYVTDLTTGKMSPVTKEEAESLVLPMVIAIRMKHVATQTSDNEDDGFEPGPSGVERRKNKRDVGTQTDGEVEKKEKKKKVKKEKKIIKKEKMMMKNEKKKKQSVVVTSIDDDNDDDVIFEEELTAALQKKMKLERETERCPRCGKVAKNE